MSKTKVRELSDQREYEFLPLATSTVSSESSLDIARGETVVETAKPSTTLDDLAERPPAFRELAMPQLPRLAARNRARLQVQSPNRIYFYWSLSSNPYQMLNRALGSATIGYSLALRLVNLESEREELHPADTDGSWWFSVDSDRSYRVEVGFYSPSQPFVRVLYSNTVKTPRRSPSPRAAAESNWRISSNEFAEVLDNSGFERDAFEVALAGDDAQASGETTHKAFRRFLGNDDMTFKGIAADELRYAMLSIASGQAIEELRFRIGAELFAILQANADRLEADRAAAAMSEFFDIDTVEFEEEEFGPAVFGSSLVNFPKRFKTRARREYSPISSHALGI